MVFIFSCPKNLLKGVKKDSIIKFNIDFKFQ